MSARRSSDFMDRSSRVIRGGLAGAVAVLMAVILVAVSIQIGSRFIGPRPVGWTEELARYATIWLTFIGSILVMSKDRHIAMDALVARFRGWLRAVFEVIAKVIIVGACIVLLPAGLTFVASRANTHSPALGIPISWVYAAAIIGFIGMALFAGVWALRAARGRVRSLADADQEIMT